MRGMNLKGMDFETENLRNLKQANYETPMARLQKNAVFDKEGAIPTDAPGEHQIPDTNLTISGFGRDMNGNSLVYVSIPGSRRSSIQTNGYLPQTYNAGREGMEFFATADPDKIAKVEQEVLSYIQQFGKPAVKDNLETYGSKKTADVLSVSPNKGFDEVGPNAEIIGGDFKTGQIYYDGRPQGGKIYEETENALMEQAKKLKKQLLAESTADSELYKDDSKWELRIYGAKKQAGVPEEHQLKVLKDTVKNPAKGMFLGGPIAEEAEKTLKEKFGYTDEQIKKLKASKTADKETPTDVKSVMIDNEEYFIKGIDSTHVYMSWNKEALKDGTALHVAQLPSKELSDAVYKWLGTGEDTFSGKNFKRGSKKQAAFEVDYMLSTEDEMSIEKGFQSKEEAEKWAKANNIEERSEDWDIYETQSSTKKTATIFDGFGYRVTIEAKAGDYNESYTPITSMLKSLDIRYREDKRYTVNPDRQMMDILVNKEDIDVIAELNKQSKETGITFTYNEGISEAIQPKVIQIEDSELKQDKPVTAGKKQADDETTPAEEGEEAAKADNAEDRMQVAKTILEQLGGGNKLKAMLGIKHFVTVSEGLGGVSFSFPNRSQTKPNVVKIVLNGLDTYDVTFSRIGSSGYKELRKVDGIYFDGLKELIENETGLYLSL